MNLYIHRCMYKWMDACMNVCMYVRIDVQCICMCEWKDVCKHGWIQMYVCEYMCRPIGMCRHMGMCVNACRIACVYAGGGCTEKCENERLLKAGYTTDLLKYLHLTLNVFEPKIYFQH